MSCRYRVDPIAAQRSVMLLYALTLALVHHCLLVLDHSPCCTHQTRHGLGNYTVQPAFRAFQLNVNDEYISVKGRD